MVTLLDFLQSKTSLQAKLKSYTSNDSKMLNSSQLMELARATFQSASLIIITKALEKKLSPKESQRKSLLKTLMIIFFLLQVGSLDFVAWCDKSRGVFKKLSHIEPASGTAINADLRAIESKAKALVYYIEHPKKLSDKREEFHKLRTSMILPSGAFKTEDEERLHEELNFTLRTPPLSQHYPSRNCQSLDIIRED